MHSTETSWVLVPTARHCCEIIVTRIRPTGTDLDVECTHTQPVYGRLGLQLGLMDKCWPILVQPGSKMGGSSQRWSMWFLVIKHENFLFFFDLVLMMLVLHSIK